MIPCTSINCFFDESFAVPVDVQIQRLADAGFRHFDMNFWDWSHSPASPFLAPTWEAWVDRIAAVASRLSVTFTQAHAHVYNFYTDPDADAKKEILVRCLRGAKTLGVSWVVFHPSQRPDWDSLPDDQRMIAENIEYFKPLAELAASLGVGIALENMPHRRNGLMSASQLISLTDGLQSPYVGICWDTGHAHIAGQNQPEAIRLMGGRLRALHVQDNSGVTDDHTAPFFGSIEWTPILTALADIAFPNDFTFEAHNIVRRVPESTKADAARLLYSIGASLCRLAE